MKSTSLKDAEKKTTKKRVKVDTFCKAIVVIVILHGVLLSTASYVLSYLGRDTVYEVSTVIITEILAPVVTYLITNMIANIFEKNKLSFSIPLNAGEWMMNKESKKEYKSDDESKIPALDDSLTSQEFEFPEAVN